MIRALALAPFALFLAACVPAAPEIDITDAWARATAPGQGAAVYASIANHGGGDDLTGASTPRASMAMVHVGESIDGVARMRMANSVAVPADGSLKLAPGGTHVMLGGLTAPLAAGENFPLTLTFAHAGPRTVTVAVVAAGDR